MVDVAFRRDDTGTFLRKIIVWSVIFHLLIVGLGVLFFWLRPEPKVEKIPIFEMVQVEQPPPVIAPRPHKVRPKPQPVEVEPEPVLTPETEPVVEEPEPEVEPEPEEVPEQEPVEESTEETENSNDTVADDFEDLPEMELPNFANMPQLRTVESILIDPLMQVYLEQLQVIIMQNFNPPDGLTIVRSARTSVQFTINRDGSISSILLKKSSRNATWDRLAVRAIKISRLPPLPPNYRAPFLPLVFDFREQ